MTATDCPARQRRTPGDRRCETGCRAFREAQQSGSNRGARAGSRLVWKIRELAGQVERYPLNAMCRRQSEERADRPEDLTPREAWNLIEAYKAVKSR